MLDDDQCGLFVTLLWGLWTIRNGWVFGGKKEEVGLVMLCYVDGWRSYMEAVESQKVRCGRKPEVVLKWEPPKVGLFKVNVDA